MVASNPVSTLQKGEHRVLRFSVLDGDSGDVPASIVGYTAKWVLARRNARDPGVFDVAVLTKDSTVGGEMTITAVTGIIDVLLNSADTEDLLPGDYEYRLVLINNGEKYPAAVGRVKLEATIPFEI